MVVRLSLLESPVECAVVLCALDIVIFEARAGSVAVEVAWDEGELNTIVHVEVL